MTCSARFDTLQRIGDLEDMLGGLVHPMSCYFYSKTSSAGECFHDPVRTHAAKQRLVRELYDVSIATIKCISVYSIL